MNRRMFLGKIHRATVTQADLHYEGSISIDKDLMEAAGFLPWEEVHVWNVTTGTRLVTYVIEGPRGSGVICINGGAAHLNKVGDLVVLATFGDMSEEQARVHTPRVVRVDSHNKIIGFEPEIAGPAAPRHH